MPAPPNYMFTIVAFVAFFLCLIKFPMRLHTWSVGTHLFLVWIGLDCIFLGINSIIWNHNTVNWAPVWCDICGYYAIASRFDVGVIIAIPAAVLCINRRLYLLASSTSVLPSEADGRREFMIDLVIGIGLPIIEMIFSFFAQNARFLIIEDFGCTSSFSTTWVSIVIITIPPILLELTAGVYGFLSIYAFYKRRCRLNESRLNFNSNRYLGLMCFSVLDLLIVAPFVLVYLCFAIVGLSPFHGLTQEHYHFSQVVQVPAVVWRATTISELTVEFKRWVMVWGAFVFFVFFGLSQESLNNYRALFQSVVQVFTMVTGIKYPPRPTNEAQEITFNIATRDLPVDTLDHHLGA